MTNIDTAEAQALILGDLTPLFEEYVGIVDSVPEGTPDVQVPHFNEIAADTIAAAIKKLPADATFEQFQAAQEKALFKLTSATEDALHKNHFVGSLSTFFNRVISIESVPIGEAEITELSQTAQSYLQIPEDRRRAAKLSDGDGYYWGGTLVRFTDK